MPDVDTLARRLDSIEGRVRTNEDRHLRIEGKDALRASQMAHIDVKFSALADQIEKSTAASNARIDGFTRIASRLVWAIVAVFIGALGNFVFRGGLSLDGLSIGG